jgi:hypothetical protein
MIAGRAHAACVQLEEARAQQASAQTRGQEESIAAITSLKESYDASLARMAAAHEKEIAAAAASRDALAEERRGHEGAMTKLQSEVRSAQVRTYFPISAIIC